MSYTVDGRELETDDLGYLLEPDYSDGIVEVIAAAEGITLTEDHWRVIRFMRDYYGSHQIAADARFAIKHLAETHGAAARKRLFELFPYGYVKQACKIAGMRRPRAWSTG